ncbi:MAG: hypothetical protein ACKOWD_19505 [Rhodoferax sp.]
MLRYVFVLLSLAVAYGGLHAQDKIYRCGNEYTNTPPQGGAAKCTVIGPASVTVLPAVRAPLQSAAQVQRSDAQRSKDADVRFILEAELRKAQARQAELLKEYNNGEPEKVGAEARNFQKYADRVAEMKASIQRNDADIASIQREIARMGGVAAR